MPRQPRRAAAARKAFAERLRSAREAAEMEPREVAKLLKVKVSTYYSWETGERMPRSWDIPLVADAVRSSVAMLLGEAA